jgi:uroporphyrinogen decarboxylase
MLAACHRQPVDATPVWYMRQAGRCLAEYRALRQQHDILTIAKTPELSAQVSLMPIDIFGVDGAVLFADIMLPLEGMGVPFMIEPEIGPIIHDPIRSMADVERLRVIEAEDATPYVFEVIRILRQELGERAAVVGFAGAPFTLACYMIEGRPSRDYATAKSMMLREPAMWTRLMETVTEVLVRYLKVQVAAGAQVIQLFDSWVGNLHPYDYERFVLPYSRRIFAEIGALGVPTIHFGTATGGFLELFASAGSDVVSVDWRINLDDAWARIGEGRGIQGNLDPVAVLGGREVAERATRDVLRRAGGRPGHIFNLGHGVLPDTDPGLLTHLVELVHTETGPGRAE